MEMIKIDPKEYGLEEKNVVKIEEAFTPKIIERDALAKMYEQLITQEISRELCQDAGDLRRQLVKVRTGIAEIHKSQKAFFLASGRFVDAWKNKETLPITQMEDKLSEMEKHYELLEEKKLQELQEKRVKELSKYIDDAHERNLGIMDKDVWEAYISTKKKDFKDRIAAEKKAEEDRIAQEKADKIEQERIRRENQQLKKAAEAREKAAEVERIQRERKEEKERLIREKEESDRKAKEEKVRLAREKDEAQRLEVERIERKKQDAKLQEEREERERVESELQAKNDKEIAAKKEQEEKKRIAELAPDKDKLIVWIRGMSIELPEITSKEAKEIQVEIAQKFEGFLDWAVAEVSKLK